MAAFPKGMRWGVVVVLCLLIFGLATPMRAGAPEGGAAAVKVYDEQANGRAQIAAAVVKAKRENRRVLIQWGGNWCGWCVALHKLFHTNPEINKLLLYEYETVMVDTGNNGKNVDLAESYGADLTHHGYPYLTVLDAEGKVLANQGTGELEVKNAEGDSVGVAAGHDPVKVLAFLKKHVAEPVKAEDVLAKGLGEAKGSVRMVFLHFGAPWCSWCGRLERWMEMPANEAALAKDFVEVKIDVDRMTGAKEMEEKWGVKGGIPWFAFVDGEGKMLVNSGSGGENIGYPGAPEEIDAFEKMLRGTVKHMSAGDVEMLVGSLREEGKKLAH